MQQQQGVLTSDHVVRYLGMVPNAWLCKGGTLYQVAILCSEYLSKGDLKCLIRYTRFYGGRNRLLTTEMGEDLCRYLILSAISGLEAVH